MEHCLESYICNLQQHQKQNRINTLHVHVSRNHAIYSDNVTLMSFKEEEEKKKVSHGNRGRTQMLLSRSLSSHWLPPFLCSRGFTDNVMQARLKYLPQCPNMALPYPPHTYLNQSNGSININKILQATGKLLHGCEV